MDRRHALLSGLALGAAGCAGPGALAMRSPARDEPPATFGTMGKQARVLERGREAELYRRAGAGTLTHMWFGGGFASLGRTRIRVYVDGEASPSIDMGLYLGHGLGGEVTGAPWDAGGWMGMTGLQGGVWNTYRVPFADGVRITAEPAPDETQERPQFWWIVRGSEDVPVIISGRPLPASARLRLRTLEAYRAAPLEEVVLADSPGRGALYQVTLAAESSNLSYMEGCVRAYIGGATEPLWVSSGLEDYFLGTYYFQTGLFHNRLAGLTSFDPGRARFSAYRFHDEDPLFFRGGLRLTARIGETVDGEVLFDPQPTTVSACAWTYEW